MNSGSKNKSKKTVLKALRQMKMERQHTKTKGTFREIFIVTFAYTKNLEGGEITALTMYLKEISRETRSKPSKISRKKEIIKAMAEIK